MLIAVVTPLAAVIEILILVVFLFAMEVLCPVLLISILFDFRDKLVPQIIDKYGRSKEKKSGRPPLDQSHVKHGSKLFSSTDKSRCQFCRLHGQVNWTQCKYPDCLFLPVLCQTQEWDCHYGINLLL